VLFVLLAGYAVALVVMTGRALLRASHRHAAPATVADTSPAVAADAKHLAATDAEAATAAAAAARDAHEMVTWSLDGLGTWLAQNDDIALEARQWLRTQLGHDGAVNG